MKYKITGDLHLRGWTDFKEEIKGTIIECKIEDNIIRYVTYEVKKEISKKVLKKYNLKAEIIKDDKEDTSLKELGISDSKIKQFNNKNIFTSEDLLKYFPKKYLDYRNPKVINEIQDGDNAAIIGKVVDITIKYNYLKLKVQDKLNNIIYMVWFNNIHYISQQFKMNEVYIFCGIIKVSQQFKMIQIISPLFDKNIKNLQKTIPVYKKIEGMSDTYLKNTILKTLENTKISEYLDEYIIQKFDLPYIEDTIHNIHFPNTTEDLENANKRIVFDELYKFNLELLKNSKSFNSNSKYIMTKCISKSFMSKLPFKLTDDQNNVLRELYMKMNNGKKVNALIQGDVGCGKTIVAIILMMISYKNGYQSALMCPTNVLAKQHYNDFLKKVEGTSCKVALLTGDLKAKEKREVLEGLKSGDINIVVGTHSIIQKDVEFNKLALTVVDEEHKFGVEQRELLRSKSEKGVHNISMTATPIPRSLALITYGETTDIYTIKSMPSGRRPIKTILYSNEVKTYVSIYNQLRQGRQCYVVCPLIEDSEAMENIDSVETTYKKMSSWFSKYPEINIDVLTGKMKEEEVSKALNKYSNNETQILISTTVVEVGVNVPNATVIMIKNAERFGLAQLHQLRGRVGRGSYQSYCVLLSNKIDNKKLNTMCETNDGFKIAEKDLELRGSGEFFGLKQTGENKVLDLILNYPKLNEEIKEEIGKRNLNKT